MSIFHHIDKVNIYLKYNKSNIIRAFTLSSANSAEAITSALMEENLSKMVEEEETKPSQRKDAHPCRIIQAVYKELDCRYRLNEHKSNEFFLSTPSGNN